MCTSLASALRVCVPSSLKQAKRKPLCFEMPHLLHLSVALATAIILLGVTALMIVASSELNPVSRIYLASPSAATRLKTLAARAAYVAAAAGFRCWPKPQAVTMAIAVGMVCWWNFRRLPFYRPDVNIVWCGMWSGILFTAIMHAVMVFAKDRSSSEQHRRDSTILVLRLIFPVAAAGSSLCALLSWQVMRPAKKFVNLDPAVKIQRIHKFDGVQEVETLSRVMRKFDQDGIVDQEAAALGETIIKAGMRLLPNSPFLLILYANFLLDVRKDGPAARTQLQLASKQLPSLVERYQIFCTGEASKRLKDSQEKGMDLQAYIEFRRNFRAVLRVHKEVLVLQTGLWSLMLRSSLKVADVDRALRALEEGMMRAHQVYRRVLERYPTNGKLLRCYGKFLEDVKHDTLAASRAYMEANRNGGGDAIMALDLSCVQGVAQTSDFLSNIVVEDDAVIVMNATGQVMTASQGVHKVFGYLKTELEGGNVSLLMPPPFSQRHNSYLQRYAEGGEPRVLDTVREVLGLHKERYVFPVTLCVTKMSGSGADSIFLGVARPMVPNFLIIRAWVAPNGVFLCGDQHFASMCSITENELVGRSLESLVDNPPEEVAALLQRCRDTPAADLAAYSIHTELRLKHRYLEGPLPVHITIGMAGTDTQRIIVLSCTRTEDLDSNLLVVDSHMRIRFTSHGLPALLGFTTRKLAGMRLDQLLPAPYGALHAKWLRDPPVAIPPTSCRTGRVVHMLTENGVNLPVRVAIRTAPASTDVGMTLYVVQVERVPPEEMLEEKRLVATVDFTGRVLSVSRPDSELFGFYSGSLVGCSLSDVVDIFQEWRDHAGDAPLQLLMLALLDKELELPGTSWRVHVHAPPSAADHFLPPIPGASGNTTAHHAGHTSRSACLQVELLEAGDEDYDNDDQEEGEMEEEEEEWLGQPSAEQTEDFQGEGMLQESSGQADISIGSGETPAIGGGAAAAEGRGGSGQERRRRQRSNGGVSWAAVGVDEGDGAGASSPSAAPPAAAAFTQQTGAHIRVTLWRTDMLTGVIEVDQDLVVKRASPMTGLIVGLPSTALLKKPFHRFLDIPAGIKWDKLVESHSRRKQRSALKLASNHAVVSPVMTFVGPHPDKGTLRILMQGSKVLAPGGNMKVTLTLRPDTTFAGARANLMHVLHVDGAFTRSQNSSVKDRKEAAGDQAVDDKQDDDSKGSLLEPAAANGGGGGDVVMKSVNVVEDVDEGASRQPAPPPQPQPALDYPPDDDEEDASSGGGHDDHSRGDSGGGSRSEADESEDDGAGGLGDKQWTRDLEAEEHARVLSRVTSKMEYVQLWVRLSTGGVASAAQQERLQRAAASGVEGASGGLEGTRASRRNSSGLVSHSVPVPPSSALSGALRTSRTRSSLLLLPTIHEDAAAAARDAQGLEQQGLEAQQQMIVPVSGMSFTSAVFSEGWDAPSGRQVTRGLSSPLLGTRGQLADIGGGGGNADKWEKGSEGGASSADGSQAASAVTGHADGHSSGDLLVDMRRSRLLRALTKRVLGPSLLEPMQRLRLHSYALLLVMLVTHTATYVVITRLIETEHHHVNLVHQQALAMDRSQLIAVRAMMGAFCERANVTEKVSVCSNSLNFTLGKLRENIDLMEQHHQYVYLGDSGNPNNLMSDVFAVWTQPALSYNFYMDTAPQRTVQQAAGAWVLGNRYLAAAREALYWLPMLRDRYRLHRTFSFLIDNGLGPLFAGYATSLDLLVNAAWRSVDQLKNTLIVLLVVEALFIQVFCLAYEWVLVQRLETARLAGILAMVGLPGPVLRQLATQEVKIIDDSDDDDESDDSDAAADEQQEAGSRGGSDGASQLAGSDSNGAGARAGGGADLAVNFESEAAAEGGFAAWKAADAVAAGTAPPVAPVDGVKKKKVVKCISTKIFLGEVMDLDKRKEPSCNANGGSSGTNNENNEANNGSSNNANANNNNGNAGGGHIDEESVADLGRLVADSVTRGVLNANGQFAVLAAEEDEPWPGFTPNTASQEGLMGSKEISNSGTGGESGWDRPPMRAQRANKKGGGVIKFSKMRMQGLHINGKELVPSIGNVTKFMVPFVLWNVALVVMYVVSLLHLNSMQGPLASLNMASHIIYRYTRVRAIAFGLVSQDDSTSRALWRDMLKTELRYFQSEYDALMYGGVPITQNSVFDRPVPASTFASTAFANAFFRTKRCFQYDQSGCLQPGDTYYEVTHNGLDAMVRRMLLEMTLLSQDEDEDVTYNSTRYMYMYAVGGKDLYDGLQQAAQLFADYSISRYNQVADLHTILLVVTVLLVLLYLVVVLWPHLLRLKNDASWQSALLSHVPPEVDVRAHVRNVYKRLTEGRAAGGGSKAPGVPSMPSSMPMAW